MGGSAGPLRLAKGSGVKILSVCRTYPTHRPGGMPHVTQDRARALAAAGHEVTVITTGLRDATQTEIDDCGVRVVHTATPPQAYTAAFAEACRSACSASYDVVHLDSFDRARPWWVDLPPPRPPVVCTMHGFGFGATLTAWNRFLAGRTAVPMPDWSGLRDEATILRTFSRVMAISPHEQWMLSDVYDLQQRVALVYNPIAPEFFAPTRLRDRAAWFVCVGNPGTSGNRDFGRARAAAHEAGRELRIVTGVDRADIPALLDDSAGLVLPTFWSQGFDLAVAESLARRRPVIASGTGSYWHLRHPWVRLVARSCAVSELADAMRRELADVPAAAAEDHRPATHVAAWLDAVQHA